MYYNIERSPPKKSDNGLIKENAPLPTPPPPPHEHYFVENRINKKGQ